MGKKGQKKKKGAQGSPGEPIDPDTLELTVPNLRDRIEAFDYRLNKAQKDRNYMQLEKDMVNRFYEITKVEMKQIDAEFLNIDQQMEMQERDHLVHIKVHEQKVQNLEYEHNKSILKVADNGGNSINKKRAMHADRVSNMNKEKTDIKSDLCENQLANKDELKMLRQGFSRSLAKTKEISEENHQKLEAQYEKQVEELKINLELRRKVEIHEIEERKNQHINELLFNHQDAFEEVKAYYNDITHDSLQLIRRLKDDISDMRERETTSQKRMQTLTQENRELSEPLAGRQDEQQVLEEKLKSYQKDKMALKNLKAHRKQLDDFIAEARQEFRSTEERYKRDEKERDDLHRRFPRAVRAIQRKAELGKNAVLEKKLEQLQGQYEEKQAQLTEVLADAKLDPAVASGVTKKLEQVVGSKNRRIKDLHYRVHQCTKSYDDTVRVYESRLPAMGIDPEEIGFEQIPNATSLMPARLVTKVR